MKNLFILLFSTVLFSTSCSKDDSVSCFNDSYTGTYDGNITINGQMSASTVKLTKKGCYIATIESASNIGDKNISSITPNGQDGFVGKLVDGTSISMNLNANTITIIANSKYTFEGVKQ
ncbi:hypothetical protein [Flavobacterium sp. GT3R68]|uniref:hypothetical protein n=1 Tax=Flavobacterium sp. GT3R68 TaxID=2594437 RepID=UPI000F88704C|nr:hypothetical protein [Flavobacterium sp. GT3R68]RTY92482.1 hypothetical protein EKL32_16900 [Flavobacterium sp. GSN2]TRW94108.1 hypothetical protein FNW07_04115 [Flavobacterium sp. GT3R68]